MKPDGQKWSQVPFSHRCNLFLNRCNQRFQDLLEISIEMVDPIHHVVGQEGR
jgi:hypothetical protein